jgi:peptidoglycan/xylan/chitin deacetylase (PgdA/CDA1 family)
MLLKTVLITAALDLMHRTGLARVCAPATRGQGVIFTMHHVLPDRAGGFQPNKLLAITPEFLERVILTLRREGYEIVTLDEAADRLEAGANSPPFAVLTFDDAYRDVRDNALPVLRRYGCPATVFVVSSFAAGRGFMWWRALEHVIATQDVVRVDVGQGEEAISTATPEDKAAAWDRIYWYLRGGDEGQLRACIATLAAKSGYDCEADCRDVCLNWDDLRALAADPLVTIGAHTVRHYMLAKWPEDVARAEIVENRADILRELSVPVDHLAYPVGDPRAADRREFRLATELGFRTAVTTRPDHLRARHRARLTGLPRVSLNGLYQNQRSLDVLLSGLPFALRNVIKRG